MMFLELWPYRSAVASPDKSGRCNLWGTVKGMRRLRYMGNTHGMVSDDTDLP